MNNKVKLSDIRQYHAVLSSALITDKDKMNITSILALLVSSNYKEFATKYEELIVNDLASPSESLVELAVEYLTSLAIDPVFEEKIITLWNTTKLTTSYNIVMQGETKLNIIRIIESFIYGPMTHLTNANDTVDFIGQMFANINGHGANGETGIVLTPYFITDIMADLLELDYKVDSIIDGACGSGSFLVAAYTKMAEQLAEDKPNLTAEEYAAYSSRLVNSIYGNDLNDQMALLTLTNFILLGLNIGNISNKDIFNIDATYFNIHSINKGILNPPFESKPIRFVNHIISNIAAETNTLTKKFIVIVPPQSMSKESSVLTSILKQATLKAVIEVQENTFIESKVNYGTSIFLFDIGKAHTVEDKVIYYDFTDSGYEYYKDSGLVDKYNTYKTKEEILINYIKNPANYNKPSTRTWTTFFDIPKVNNFEISIDPDKIKNKDVEETDLTKANQEIKKILSEKKELIDSVNNKIPATPEFIDYLVDVLSEV